MEALSISEFYRSFLKPDARCFSDDEQLYSIHRTEEAIRHIGPRMDTVRWNYYFLSLIGAGGGIKNIGSFRFVVNPHTLWFVPLSVLNNTEYWHADTRGYYIKFTREFLLEGGGIEKDILNSFPGFKYNRPPYLALSKNDSDYLADLFEGLIKEMQAPFSPNIQPRIIRLKIIELLIRIEDLIREGEQETQEQNTQKESTIEEFQDLIRTCFEEHKKPSFYAEKLNIHPNYLNQICKRILNKTASDLINEWIVGEAKFLLHSSELRIKEISDRLGYEDVYYFSKFFKHQTLMSPSAYRTLKSAS